MLFKIYSVYDSKVECYFPPFLLKNKGEAVRGFAEIANDGTSNISKYPYDFTLFELGTFDDATAKFVLHSTPISIGVALEYVRSVNDRPSLVSGHSN